MLHHIKSEQEAHETNAELLSSLSHDIRTPLTVLMGYIEMMKEHEGVDDLMASYISATESTALRLKQLSDNMFRFSLAFGDGEKSIKLEVYDARTLFEQLFAEHFVLMREMGYDIRLEKRGEEIKEGNIMRTDPPNLMRIIDNVFSNLRKYADINQPIVFSYEIIGDKLVFECKNAVLRDARVTESSGIGLKTCVKLGSLVAEKFEYERDGDYFISRLVVAIHT
jgi:signal transduction histidine kinase